jgi:antitoxin component YwqK of YwqJK toxin-antitoxin module
MKKISSLLSLIMPLLVVVSSCTPPKPSTDEVICEAYVHRYGIPLPPDEWSARGQNGHVVSLQKDGVVVTKCYDQGILHGTTTYSFPYRETVQRDEVYENGTLTQENFYYKSGLPFKQVTIHSPDRRSVVCWFENGAPQSCEEYEGILLTNGDYYNFTNQIESRVDGAQGQRTCRDGQGQLIYIDDIDNGQIIQRTAYHQNGTPSSYTPYVNGVIEGYRKSYHPNGEPATVEEWTNHKQQGWTVFYENGDRISEIQYQQGYKHGIERRYRDGETLAQELTWEKGRKHGPCYTYLGNAKQTDWYFDDRLVNKVQFDVMSQQ